MPLARRVRSRQWAGRVGYELTSHTGDVKAVVSDLSYKNNPALWGAYDHHPYGAPIASRWVELRPYRFSLQGQDREDLLGVGPGDVAATESRYYSAWLARWYSIDAHAQKYPGWSPYAAFASNPILFADADGRDNVIYLVFFKPRATP